MFEDHVLCERKADESSFCAARKNVAHNSSKNIWDPKTVEWASMAKD